VTNLQVVGVGIRVFGVWKFLTVLYLVVLYLPWVFSVAASRDTYIALIFPAIWLVLSAFMIVQPIAIARHILPDTNEPAAAETSSTWSIDELQAVLFSALGVYFLVTSIPQFQGWLQAWTQRTEQLQNWDPYTISNTISQFISLVVGLWLLMGAKGLRGFIRWCRASG
jgi:hypothetical protein